MLNTFEPTIKATSLLLQQLQVNVTNTAIDHALHNHPDYPSILGISDVLKQWHVDNMLIKTTVDKLEQLPVPFLAATKKNGYVTVLAVNNQAVTVASKNGKGKEIKAKENFINDWAGVVLLAEALPNAGEKEYAANLRKQQLQQLRVPSFFVLALVLGIIATIVAFGNGATNIAIAFGAFTLLKFAGFVVSSLLLWYEVDKANPLLKQICTAGAKTNCNAILSSKQSKLFGVLSWSEIGFFYFAGGFLFLLFTPNLPLPTAYFLTLFNLLALPYTFFSIYYQWKVAKQWCVLCLAVQVLLISEFIVSLSTGQLSNLPLINQLTNQPINPTPTLIPNSQFLITFLLPIIIWYILKPNLLKAEENKRNKRALMRLKYDARIFEALLPKQKQITTSAEGLGISIGNPSATNTIIKVCNPYCGPCASAHPEIEAILEANSNVKAQVIFTTKNTDDPLAKPSKHLLAIAAKGNEAQTKLALDAWYLADKKDYDVFAEQFPMNGEVEKQGSKLEAMENWCKQTDIQFTPTLFINGYQLPDVYSVGDLKYLLS